MTQNGVPQPVTIEDAEAAGQGIVGTAITWILPSTPTGEQPATYSVTISGILNANHQPLPDISYTTTTFVPTPTTATLTSQVEFLAPTNQTAFGSATSTVTLARSLSVAAPLSVIVQGNGVSQEVDFAAGQAYATAILPTGSFTLTDPQGGVVAPGGGTTQVVPSNAGGRRLGEETRPNLSSGFRRKPGTGDSHRFASRDCSLAADAARSRRRSTRGKQSCALG